MKQKNLYLALSIIIAVLALGIAYAAITTQTLNVTGNIATTTSDANLDVEMYDDGLNFGVWKDTDHSGVVYNNGSIQIINGKNAVINVSGLTTKGDSVCAMIPVANHGEVWAEISDINVEHENIEWFSISAQIGDDIGPTGSHITLEPGRSEYAIYIYITLKDTPATDAEAALASDTIKVTFDVDAIDNPNR